jgi:hypothetical protein
MRRKAKYVPAVHAKKIQLKEMFLWAQDWVSGYQNTVGVVS